MMQHLNLPFLWGAATSAHQVEGYNDKNDWWTWEMAGRVREASGQACDHYRLFPEDVALAGSLGHNAHRFSLEWSRFEPDENRWNDEAFRHYEAVLRELRHHGLEPVVTLHHFTNPQWFTAKGGWLRPDAPLYFARYVRRVVEAFAPHVRFWVTLNEPDIYLYHGYYTGIWPPGHRSTAEALIVFRHLLHGHCEAYRLIHQHYDTLAHRPVWVSIAKHLCAFTPDDEGSSKDRYAVLMRHWFFNRSWFEGLLSGFLFFPGLTCEFLPARRTLDFLGINYYSRNRIRFSGWLGEKAVGEIAAPKDSPASDSERNSLGWEICPQGFYQILRDLKCYDLPVMVLENGICTLDDDQRRKFIDNHFSALRQAMNEGVRVCGYFYWSLLDNFEWADGFSPRFGLVEVDYQSQERKVRPSAYVLRENCRKLITAQTGNS